MQPLPGIVHVEAGSSEVRIESATDWSSLISPGDVIRIGGGSGNESDGLQGGKPGTSGDILSALRQLCTGRDQIAHEYRSSP